MLCLPISRVKFAYIFLHRYLILPAMLNPFPKKLIVTFLNNISVEPPVVKNSIHTQVQDGKESIIQNIS